MKIHNYEKLLVWQKSMELVSDIYLLTRGFPKEEMYGLTSQVRRSAVSIPSNIAEGSRRSTDKDFCSFLYNALGSASELETQIKIGTALGFLDNRQSESARGKIVEILRMLNKLIESKSRL